MFISVLDVFKIGIGPSSSHTMGPMLAAHDFLAQIKTQVEASQEKLRLCCRLKGSLALTGEGHGSDKAVALGLHGYLPLDLSGKDVDSIVSNLWQQSERQLYGKSVDFSPATDICLDKTETLPAHPNGMVFQLWQSDTCLVEEVYFSIGGGFLSRPDELEALVAPMQMQPATTCPHPFDSAANMLEMSQAKQLSIAELKRDNEQVYRTDAELSQGLDAIWQAMQTCVEQGLSAEGILPGGLEVKRRAKHLYQRLNQQSVSNLNDLLCAYAMAVNEENAAGHMVVTAPTNGAAGVIPALLYYLVKHENINTAQIHDFLLTAAAIGGIIKHRSSISGAEVGCQGEVGSAAAMGAAGLCAVQGGTTEQIENAAEIALEHHLGMTCDPVKGLVQVPCIERNGFGAIKAYTAASLALHGSGVHLMPLDACIAAMRQTGLEMSEKYKETALGGLAVSFTEC